MSADWRDNPSHECQCPDSYQVSPHRSVCVACSSYCANGAWCMACARHHAEAELDEVCAENERLRAALSAVVTYLSSDFPSRQDVIDAERAASTALREVDERPQPIFADLARAGRGKRTQAAVAAEIGVTQQAVSQWELGVCLPETALLPRVAEVYGVAADELLAAIAAHHPAS